jgi:hypothetical protein
MVSFSRYNLIMNRTYFPGSISPSIFGQIRISSFGVLSLCALPPNTLLALFRQSARHFAPTCAETADINCSIDRNVKNSLSLSLSVALLPNSLLGLFRQSARHFALTCAETADITVHRQKCGNEPQLLVRYFEAALLSVDP